MVKIIGIPTEDEALSLYNAWKQKLDDGNKQAKRHDNILVWSVLIIGLALITGLLLWIQSWPTDIPYLDFARVSGILVVILVGLLTIVLGFHGQWEYNEFSWPTKYKYYTIIKDKTVLETKLDNGTIYFTLENAEHEVTVKSLAICNEKHRTDIDEIIVDLDKEEILIPYKKNN